MVNKPKQQGTAWESQAVKWLQTIGGLTGVRRIAEGGAKDIGDIEWHDAAGYEWIGECKATKTLNVTRVLGKARSKSTHPHRTVLLWKRLTKSKGNTKRTPDGEPVVVVMGIDTFETLMRSR